MKCEINKRQAEPDKQGKSRKQNKNKKITKKKYENRIQTGQAASVRGSEGEREGGDTDKARVHVVSKLPSSLSRPPHYLLSTNCPHGLLLLSVNVEATRTLQLAYMGHCDSVA